MHDLFATVSVLLLLFEAASLEKVIAALLFMFYFNSFESGEKCQQTF